MKIILVNNLYGKYSKGGAEAVVEKTKEALEKNKNKVYIFSTYPGKPKNKIKKEENIYYFPSKYFNLNKLSLLSRLIWHVKKINDKRQNKLLEKTLKEIKPDLIITHNLMGFSGNLPKIINKNGIKHIHCLHDTQLLHPSGRLCLGKEKIIDTTISKQWQKIKKEQFKQTKYIISPSNWLLKLHQKKDFFLKTKNLLIPNPLEIKSNNKNEEKEKLESEKIKKENKINNLYTFVYLGQIDKEKGIHLLLSAFENVSKHNNDSKKIKLKIIGNGKDLPKLKKENENNKNIIFTGYLNKNNFTKELKDSNCLILPSLIYENSPTAIFDAYTNNLDVIASDIGGTPEIINRYYGYTFKAGSEKDLINKMKIVLKESKVKKTELEKLSSVNYIKNIFSWLNQ